MARFKTISTEIHTRSQENNLAGIAFQHMQVALKKQLKDLFVLKDKILPMFTTVHNTRERYYTQLNYISDTVKSTDFGEGANVNDLDEAHSNLKTKLLKDLGRNRYLVNLKRNQNVETDGSAVESERQCVVCRDTFSRGFITECGHVTCDSCTSKWTKVRRKCPTCNSPVVPSSLAPISFKLDQSSTSKSADQDRTDRRLKLIKSIKLMKSYGTKIDMICKHILTLLEEEPETKMLVFSQWEEMLSIVGNSLKAEKIGFVGLDGRGYSKNEGDLRKSKNESLSLFKAPGSDINCLMLHAKSQSSGLNLTEATHVFLLEPILQKGLEQQATGRIHRIGQSRATFVYRYLVEGTIEMYLNTARSEDAEESEAIAASRGGENISTEMLFDFFEPLLSSKE